jgi:endonuclease/exonuclease/phosphatase family metal-dependent hydrolase
LTAEVDSGIGKVRLLNVHLRPPLSDKGSATISALYNSPDIHRKELKQFIRDSGQDIPLIIAGDFNEHEAGKGLSWLFANGFTDALSIYDNSSDTWVWELGYGLQLDDRYDHLIFSKQLKCTGAKVLKIDNASDHMPVLGVFIKK